MSMLTTALGANRAEFELNVGPYGATELGLLSFDAWEEVSRPFSAEITFVGSPQLKLEELEGQKALITVVQSGGEARFFDGRVEKIESLGPSPDPRKWRYRIRLRPRLWTLQGRRRSRVFQVMTVPEIVGSVLKDAEVEHRWVVERSYPRRDYCVQYSETDLDFVSRLLEEEGIFYFFEHRQGEHAVVFGDSVRACPPLSGGTSLGYREARGMIASGEAFTDFGLRRATRPSSVVLKDINYLHPQVDLTARSVEEAIEPLEIYEHHGRYEVAEVGQSLARVRLEEARVPAALWSGHCTSRRLCPGYLFELTGHSDPQMDGEYLVISVRHRGNQPETVAGELKDGKPGYQNHLVCLRSEIPFRPERRTPRPSIAGWQSAVVVGPSSEEIHTDPHGRVKVQFHWDREGRHDDRSSCWIRVAQAVAGPGFGALYLPRIGQEVVVSFEEGDPDRPLILGAAYNGLNTTPLDLPAQKTKSTLRTDSSPHNGGFNELRFEDATGSEEVYLHAQKDLRIEVENDKTQSVGGNETLLVQKDRSRTVWGNQSLVVKKNDRSKIERNQTLEVVLNRSTTVGANHTETVEEDQSITVGGAQTVTVGLASTETVRLAKSLSVGAAYTINVGAFMNEAVVGAKTEEVGAERVETVGANKSETVGGSRSLTVGRDVSESVGQNRTVRVDKDLAVSVGANLSQSANQGYTLKAKRIEIAAEEEYALKVGSASMVFNKNGEIKISGSQILVNGTDSVVLKGSKIVEN